ncbi:MAG TPA: hypothetical protein VGS58_06880 [Candidatus Sulfopaludibacter sp.]|nr:hypothetical protein [Candidatus Sulfopaludibacter sp.]
MPGAQRSSEGIPIRADLVEAGLDTGFALLHLAKTQSGSDARRVLREARAACLEGERRLARLSEAEHRRLRVRFADLRQAIARAGHKPAGARILRMPAR